MADAVTLEAISPERFEIAPDPHEETLRRLYFHRPGVVRLGLIASADGKAAGPDGSSRTLNGPADLRILTALRSCADVVLVGARTARRERYTDISLSPELVNARSRHHSTPAPMLAIATYSGTIPSGLNPSTTWIMTTAHAPAMQRLTGVWQQRILIAGLDSLSPRTLAKELEQHGMARVLCEGGPEIANGLLGRRVIGDYCLTTSPLIGGGDAERIPAVPATMRRAHALTADGYTFERWVSPDA